MENKKIGIVILTISVLLLLVFVVLINSLNQEAEALGCFEKTGCKSIETSLSIVHFAFGAFGFLFSLGFYLIFFSKGDKAIIKRLEEDTKKRLGEEKFSILLQGLNPFEQRVIKAVREQPGVTQNTLRLRTNTSKAKLSQILKDLEKKNLIKREKERKTLAIYLTHDYS